MPQLDLLIVGLLTLAIGIAVVPDQIVQAARSYPEPPEHIGSIIVAAFNYLFNRFNLNSSE